MKSDTAPKEADVCKKKEDESKGGDDNKGDKEGGDKKDGETKDGEDSDSSSTWSAKPNLFIAFTTTLVLMLSTLN